MTRNLTNADIAFQIIVWAMCLKHTSRFYTNDATRHTAAAKQYVYWTDQCWPEQYVKVLFDGEFYSLPNQEWADRFMVQIEKYERSGAQEFLDLCDLLEEWDRELYYLLYGSRYCDFNRLPF